MPSTNKLASHKSSRQPRHHVRGSIARFLLSFCGLASFGVVATLIALSTNTVYAESSSSNTITANLPGSVAIRLLDSTGTTEISSLNFNNLTPTPQGTTASKSFIVDVATSNPTGYKLYMQSDYQDSNNNYTTNLTHTDTDVADNIPTLVPGSGSSADTKVYWNYVNPLTNSGSSNPTPSVIPPYGTPDKIAQYFSPTNSHQSTIDINVGIDTTIVSGTYENQLLFSAVGNPTNLDYSVTFNMDGGEPQIAKIEDTAAAGSDSITIPNTIPTKSGHAFSHWQIVIPTGSTATASCNNTSTCNPGDNVVIHSGINTEGNFEGDIILKAVYDATYTYTVSYDCNGGTGCPENTTYGPTTDTSYNYTIPSATITKQGYAFTNFLGSDSQSYDIGDTISLDTSSTSITLTAQYDAHDITIISNMQDMTSELCANTIIGTSTTLTDTRDNNTYTVKKLKDGNCWMTQNLNLQGPITLTSADSDVSSNWILPSTTENYWDAGTIPLVDPNGGSATTLTDKWCADTSEECENQIVNMYSGNASFGAYYTWRAATAGSGDYSTESGNANSSVCPKGWRLPTGGPVSDYYTLYNFYPTTGALRDNDGPSIVLSGARYRHISEYQNEVGVYWSSTAISNSNAYMFYLNDSGGITPGHETHKSRGRTIRCLAKDMSGTLTVDPNGGTWEGSTSTQTFTQDSGTTKTITNPISPDTYTITYDANGQGASYTGSPTSVTRAFYGWTLSGNGTYAGGTYAFGPGNATLTAQYDPVSDSFTLPTITKSGATCGWMVDGVSYTSGQSGVVVSSDTTFKAVCQSTTFNGITTMQQMTPTICNVASIGETATLTDTRDNNTYTVKKLNDGNCWMTQNLRLTSPSNGYINNTDSDVNSQVSWSTISATTTCSGTNSCVYYGNNVSYGAYYSWYAATAGSGTSDMSYPDTAPYSICPKGWRLPTAIGSNDFYMLSNNSAYDSFDKMTSLATGPQFTLPGLRSGSSIGYMDNGYYWSNTASDKSANANILFLRAEDSVVAPTANYYKYAGFSVRCIAKGSGSLTVDPNGGTWNGSTERQTFTQDAGTTKTISNPAIDNPETYTISYDDNGQGASYTGTPTSVDKSASWSLYGNGTYAGGIYQFGNGGGTLVAHYNNTTSNSFILPTITKSGSTCAWAEGGPDGALYDGGSSRTVLADTTYYAVCGPTVTVSASNVSPSVDSLFIPSGRSKTVTVTPNSGYYLSSVTCPSGYTCSGYSTGSSATGAQTITVKNDGTSSNGTLTVTGAEVVKYMQDQTYIDQCKNGAEGTTYTLRDSRDNRDYKVRKLKDGKCWMVENLHLTGRDTAFTPDDTQVAANFTMTTSASNTGTWCTTNNANCNDRFQYIDTGSTYGVLYNWYTATAGSGKYSTSSGTAAYSICPRGWRLPTSGGTSGEFAKLDIAWGGTGANRTNANTYSNFTNTTTADASHGNFILAGYRNGSSTSGQGTLGSYWSSTARNSNGAYYLYLVSSYSYVYPSHNSYKYYGFSVRCVAQ